jgi:LL-diaminopimelate aminotransferase
MKGFSDRIETVQEYYFSAKLREVNQLIGEGKPVINLGIGSPDLAPDRLVIDALKSTVEHPEPMGTKTTRESRSSGLQWQSFTPENTK